VLNIITKISNIPQSNKIGCFDGSFLTLLLSALKERGLTLSDAYQKEMAGKRIKTTLVTSGGDFSYIHGEYSCNVFNLMKPIDKMLVKAA
jgi:hypothetical protein